MGMRRMVGRKRLAREAAVLVEDAQAYLRGGMARRLDDRRQPAPAWAWVNALAHADPDELTVLARRPGPGMDWRVAANRAWGRVLPPLAAELLVRADADPAVLRRLQWHVLIPLELRLARPGPTTPGRPDQLAARVRAALDPVPSPAPSGRPGPPVGRGLGTGRLNRVAFSILGPASVSSAGPVRVVPTPGS